MMKIRCSSLPQAVACAPSVQPPSIRIEGERLAADLGSAFHAAMAAAIKTGGCDFTEIAAQFNVEVTALAPLVSWAMRLWLDRLEALFPNPHVETLMTGFAPLKDGAHLSGTPDVIAFADGEVRGLDWKTGWADVDAEPQLRGYALVGLEMFPAATQARMTRLRVRDQRADTYVWSRQELLSWWGWLCDHLRSAIYRPGPHCGRCSRALECEARQRWLGDAATWLVDTNPGRQAATANAEELAGLLEIAKAVEKAVAAAISAVKAEVQARGGKVGHLEIISQERRSIDLARAWPVLVERFGQDKTLELATISKSDVEKVAKDAAPRREKGAAVQELLRRLEAENALTVTVIERLEIRRKDHEQGDNNSDPGKLAAGEPTTVGAE